MELRLEELLIRELCLIFCYERRRQGSIKRILDDLVIFAGAKQYADRRLLMGFLYVTIKSFQIEAEFTEVLWFEPSYLKFECHKTVQAAMEKQQIECKVALPNLNRVLRTDEAEIPAEFN